MLRLTEKVNLGVGGGDELVVPWDGGVFPGARSRLLRQSIAVLSCPSWWRTARLLLLPLLLWPPALR
jgi:hypothetical protein